MPSPEQTDTIEGAVGAGVGPAEAGKQAALAAARTEISRQEREWLLRSDRLFRSNVLRLCVGALFCGVIWIAILVHNRRERHEDAVAYRRHALVLDATFQQRAELERLHGLVLRSLEQQASGITEELLEECAAHGARWQQLVDGVAEHGQPVVAKDTLDTFIQESVVFGSVLADAGILEGSLGVAEASDATSETSGEGAVSEASKASTPDREGLRLLEGIVEQRRRTGALIDELLDREAEVNRYEGHLEGWLEAMGLLAMLIAVGGITVPTLAGLRRQNGFLKQQAERLAEFSLVARMTSNAVAMTDSEGRIEWVNPGYEALSGYAAEEVIGTAWLAWLERRASVENRVEAICAAISDGVPLQCQTRKRHRSGRDYYVELDMQPLFDHADELRGFQFVETDVTYQKEAERRLRAKREYLKATLMAIGDGVISTDQSGKVTAMNPVAARLSGWCAKAAKGQPIEEVLPTTLSRSGGPAVSPVRTVLATGEAEQSEGTFFLKGSEGEPLLIASTTNPMRDEQGEVCGCVIIIRDVTEQHEAQAALREINDRFEMATIAAGFGVWDWEFATSKFTWYESCYRLYGMERGEFADDLEAWSQAIHPDDAAQILEQFERAVREAASFEAEFRIIHGDGRPREVRACGRVITDAYGVPVRLCGIHFDITAQREAERKLVSEHQRAESALDGGRLGLFDWDLSSGAVLYDRRWAGLLGEAVDTLDMRIETWVERVHQDDVPPSLELVQRDAGAGNGPFRWLHRLLHADGSWRWMLARGRVVEWSESEEPLRVVGTLADVTSERRTQLTLQRSEAALAATSRMTRVGWWELDSELTTWSLSETAASMFGMHDTDGIGFTQLLARFDAGSRGKLETRLRALAESQEGFDLELQLVADERDGAARWVRVIGQNPTLPARDFRPILGAFQDITEVRQRQAELERARAEAEEMALVAEAATRSKSEFLANMSHELRTPLTAILGFADLLGERLGTEHGNDTPCERALPGPEPRDAIGTIQRNGQHLLRLINDILDVSKVEAGQMELETIPCNTVQCMDDVITMMRGKADEKSVRLYCTYGSQVPVEFLSDPLRLKQILVNLIGNAIKFTERGEVHVVVSCDRTETGPSTLRIRVIDTGIGLGEAQIKRLFRPFSQGDSTLTRRFGGTGLGLVISKRLAQLLGGDIEVRSEPNKGSTFTVCVRCEPVEPARWILPDQAERAESGRVESGQLRLGPSPGTADDSTRCNGGLPALLGLRVLIAEDGVDNQRLLKLLLSKAGAEVTIVENGSETLDLLTAQWERPREPAPFDVVLMDMQMPVMDGYTATQRLREIGCQLPIIALTAHAMVSDRQKCMDAGCTDYLVKPIERPRLFETLAGYLPSDAGGTKGSAADQAGQPGGLGLPVDHTGAGGAAGVESSS